MTKKEYHQKALKLLKDERKHLDILIEIMEKGGNVYSGTIGFDRLIQARDYLTAAGIVSE